MKIDGFYIVCPKCGWEPDDSRRWVCDVCQTRWNTFETHGVCPCCGKVYEDTYCSTRGGCGQPSLNSDWYREDVMSIPIEKNRFNWFWKKEKEPPIGVTDKQWIEQSLLSLAEMVTPEYFKSLVTITPEKKYFDRDFTGIEEDVNFILQTVASLMNIKTWEIQLMFFSDIPTRFSEGILATPSRNLKNSWTPKTSELIDKGFGTKEIWVELAQLNDPIGLIATISTELAKYKLQNEYAIEDDIYGIADLTSIMFGFGIFKGNSYFKFSQWSGNSHHGWQMQKTGGLAEPLIAYAMAWLAHYRNEDISWKQFMNKTMRKYFEKSYKYIGKLKNKG